MDDFYPEGAERYVRFRDWTWAGGRSSRPRVARVGEPDGPEESELEIQARWFAGEFGRTFRGEDGEQIEIVQFGHWNRGEGPDFSETAVRVDGALHRGAIEIDLDARDWEKHGHGSSPRFEDVVLHVYTDRPSWKRFFTRTASHRRIVQVQLPQYAWSQGPPDFLPEAFPGRCVAPLARMADEEVDSLLRSAAQFRLREKATRFEMMRSTLSPDQALFQGLAEALGFRANKTAMAVLAQRVPIERVVRLDRIEREAALFGAAGFLTSEHFEHKASPDARRYLRDLWDCWWKIRSDFETAPHRAIPWQYSGLRPLNHPHRRIGALSAVIEDWEPISRLWEETGSDVKNHVNNLLNNLRHSFWENHFTLQARPAGRRHRLVGRDRGHDILGNVIFPGAMGLHARTWDQYQRLRKVDSNRNLRRAALRLFGPDEPRRKLFTSSYYQQQGLLQIYRDFCLEDASECSQCPFPEQLVQWKRFAGRGDSLARPSPDLV